MPLKSCHECGHNVSTKASKCPNCGAPMKESVGQVMMPRKKGTAENVNWPLRIAIAVICGILALILFALS